MSTNLNTGPQSAIPTQSSINGRMTPLNKKKDSGGISAGLPSNKHTGVGSNPELRATQADTVS